MFFRHIPTRFSRRFSHYFFTTCSHSFPRHVFHASSHQIITATLRHHLGWLRRACGGLVVKSRRPVECSGEEVRTRGRCQSELFAINRNLLEKQGPVAAPGRFQSFFGLAGRPRVRDSTSENSKYEQKSRAVYLVIPRAESCIPGCLVPDGWTMLINLCLRSTHKFNQIRSSIICVVV